MALNPPPWHTALPWQQPHALPQPSPCQRWSYSLTAGMNGDCRHLMSACTCTNTHSNTLTQAHKPTGKTHGEFYTLTGTKHVTHFLISQIEAAVCVCVCVCVCVSFISVCLCLSISPSSNWCPCMQSVCIWAMEKHCTHTLCTSRTAVLVCEGHKGGIRKKKEKRMSVNTSKHNLSFS